MSTFDLVLGPGATDAPLARSGVETLLVDEALPDGRLEIVLRVVEEIIADALANDAGPVAVRVARDDDAVRVEVTGERDHQPRAHPAEAAMPAIAVTDGLQILMGRAVEGSSTTLWAEINV